MVAMGDNRRLLDNDNSLAGFILVILLDNTWVKDLGKCIAEDCLTVFYTLYLMM